MDAYKQGVEGDAREYYRGVKSIDLLLQKVDAEAQAILRALAFTQPDGVIMVFGGAKGLDNSRKALLTKLFTDAIAPAAAELGTLIIDGGTQSGVMAMIGEALARDGRGSQLL